MSDSSLSAYAIWLEAMIHPSRQTARIYRQVARRIMASGRTPQAWLESVLDQWTPRGTVGTYLPAARRYHEYLTLQGDTPGPVPHARIPQESRPPPDGLTPAELVRYTKLVQGLPEPHRTILALLPKTGLRISEMVGLPVAAVHRSGADWYLEVRGKGRGGQESGGGKVRDVPLSSTARDLLASWLENPQRTPSLWVFPSKLPHVDHFTSSAVQAKIRRVRNGANLPRLSPHVLRHTFAERFLDRHGYERLAALQDILGHASLVTTRRYAKSSKHQLRQLIETVDPPEAEDLVQA